MKAANKQLGPKQRIIDTALDLFYNQGYLATGINQIIQEAGVSKASFYDHFKSKEDLCVAYLQSLGQKWGGRFKAAIDQYEQPLDRFLAPLDFFDKWLQENGFRGCAFLNITSEITDAGCTLRKEVIYAKDGVRSVIRELTKDLKNSGPEFKDLDVDDITDAYYLITEGVISACQIYSETWPIAAARKSVKKLIGLN